MTRAEFSKKTKEAALSRAGHKCECCHQKITQATGVEYDHIIEAYLTNDNSLENCRVLCAKCHRIKTQARRFEIDKTRRVYEKAMGLRSKGRPMDGSRRSQWKKKFGGGAERR
jgi:HNH endonuclease